MFVVTSRSEGTTVELWCSICFTPLTRDIVLIFPSDGEHVEGHWAHEACASGHLRTFFGTPHVTMMQGWAALSHLAQAMRGMR